MSKESYIGGDYIEFTKGDNKTFSKGNIVSSSTRQVINTSKNQTINYGTNKFFISESQTVKPTYYLWLRSFISAKSLRDPAGRKFDGDYRKASLSLKKEITSRGKAKLTIDLQKNNVKISNAFPDTTHMRPYYKTDVVERIGKIYYRLNVYKRFDSLVIDLLYSTRNPLTPKGLTPSVDVKARIVINYSEFTKFLIISYNIYGDGYSSTECFISDKNNKRLFLGVKKEIRNPGIMLPGGTDRNLISGILNVQTDEEGNFISVDSNKSIEQHNSMIEQSFK